MCVCVCVCVCVFPSSFLVPLPGHTPSLFAPSLLLEQAGPSAAPGLAWLVLPAGSLGVAGMPGVVHPQL